MSPSVPVFQLCGAMVSASEDSTPSVIYHCVLRGLERLLLSEQLSRVDGEALVKLSVDRVNMPSPHRAMAALGLMLTCMYTGKKGTNVADALKIHHKCILVSCILAKSPAMYCIRTGAFTTAVVTLSVHFKLTMGLSQLAN